MFSGQGLTDAECERDDSRARIKRAGAARAIQ